MPRRPETRGVPLDTGRDPGQYFGAISYPIYQTAPFAHPGVGESTGYDYSRLQNPTQEQVAQLENGTDAFALASGMAAVDRYGGSIRLVDRVARPAGLEVTSVDCSQEDVGAQIRDNTAAIYVETPTRAPTCSGSTAAVLGWSRVNWTAASWRTPGCGWTAAASGKAFSGSTPPVPAPACRTP